MTIPTRRLLAIAVATAVATAVVATAGGCGSSSITGDVLENHFGPTFANMYVLQQRLLGRSDAVADTQMREAICTKGGPDGVDEGPGHDWICQVYWPQAEAGRAPTVSYEVEVKPAGCYTAQGPATVVGQQTLQAADGRTVANPLFEFYGCLNLG
jgi:hypothetical protein